MATANQKPSRSALNPLPSLIRASAQDAGNAHMRKACRAKWNDDDWNAMCDVQERLIRSCYGRSGDHNNPDLCYIRFQIAEQMEKRGEFSLFSDVVSINQQIDAKLNGEAEAA